MRTLTLVALFGLLGASTGEAGILKMSCQKPVCPCSSYGPCGGFFPTIWHRWPCATPGPAVIGTGMVETAPVTQPAVTAPAPVGPDLLPPRAAPGAK